ncbi:hypothetical protein GH714_015122 [Hevea brasiliensis]|uniref:Reverse transcriptase Ty1/copia-type domain-containing protein n=1 Tax=Hevea brasiliensis TaxID=3981 RepID=A0A6A6LK68_HEVBR|nr:hypothetical protein GH714_015122 [Hevea brasiliensis]
MWMIYYSLAIPLTIYKSSRLFTEGVYIEDLGSLDYFLGVEVTPTKIGIHLSQTKYISYLLTKARMQECNGIATPATSDDRLCIHGVTQLRIIAYIHYVGGLQYLSFTRTNISFAVNKVSQFVHSPSKQHWFMVKRILCYLHATPNYGLQITKSSTQQIHAYSYANWASSLDDRKSTTGIGGSLDLVPIVAFHGLGNVQEVDFLSKSLKIDLMSSFQSDSENKEALLLTFWLSTFAFGGSNAGGYFAPISMASESSGDKSPEKYSSSAEVVEMYNVQKLREQNKHESTTTNQTMVNQDNNEDD